MNKVTNSSILIHFFIYFCAFVHYSSIFFFLVFCQQKLQILKELHRSCQREDGSDDQKKGTQLLEVYAIEIQMYTETKNNKKLKVAMFFYIYIA